MAAAAPTELRVRLAPELSLAAITYGDPTSLPVVSLHGWMDNAASFAVVGPALARLGLYAVCLELPGHGQSDHRPPSCHYVVQEYAANVCEALTALGFPRFALCGHSLGAGLAPIVAAAEPRRCVGVVLLEGLGPSTRPPSEAPELFARAVAAKAHAQSRAGGGSSYATVADAVAQRLATVARYGGGQTLSAAGAELLVRRALVQDTAAAGGAWRFRHDRRIAGPYIVYWHEDHVLAILRAIRCPVLVVSATAGWPRDAGAYAARLEVLRAAACSVTHVTLPGGHHLHLDPDTAPAVCDALAAWVRGSLLPHAQQQQQQQHAQQGKEGPSEGGGPGGSPS